MKSAHLSIIFGAVVLIAVCSGGVIKNDDQNTPKPPTPSPWFECPGDEDGSFVNPYNCHKYFVCISGTAWAFNCPANLYFNEAKGICDIHSHVNCKPVVTTKPTS